MGAVNGVQGAAGSNPVVPTSKNTEHLAEMGQVLFLCRKSCARSNFRRALFVNRRKSLSVEGFGTWCSYSGDSGAGVAKPASAQQAMHGALLCVHPAEKTDDPPGCQ